MSITSINKNSYDFINLLNKNINSTYSKNPTGHKDTIATNDGTPIQNNTFNLHLSKDGETIGAVCFSDGTSITISKNNKFDPSNPIYNAKIYNTNGNIDERDINVSNINSQYADSVSMYTLSSHLADVGLCKDAQGLFLGLYNSPDLEKPHMNDSLMTNWKNLINKMAKMQYSSGNISRYNEYLSLDKLI